MINALHHPTYYNYIPHVDLTALTRVHKDNFDMYSSKIIVTSRKYIRLKYTLNNIGKILHITFPQAYQKYLHIIFPS